MCSILAFFSWDELLIASSILIAISSTSYGLMMKAPCNALAQPLNSETMQDVFSNLPCYLLTLTNSRGCKQSPSLSEVFKSILEKPHNAHLSSIEMFSFLKIRQPNPNSSCISSTSLLMSSSVYCISSLVQLWCFNLWITYLLFPLCPVKFGW